jgi:ABC-type phosphate transport system substrate-binding protein
MNKLFFALIVTLIVASSASSAPVALAPAYVVIVHPSNPTASLSTAEVAKMFLKQTSKWPNGWPVTPVDQVGSSKVREAFSERILARGVRSIKSFWKQQIYSGRGVPPAERESDGEVVKFVLSNRGGIGYVAPAAVGTAKILQVR